MEQWYNNGYAAELTNGIYMTEPSGSMYGTIVKYTHKMGFPDEMIWTLDPTNSGTGAINILDGDTTQVKGLFETYLNDLVIQVGLVLLSFLTKKDNLLIISLRSLKR